MNFQLHPRLEQDGIPIGRFELSLLLLMNDNRFPWYLLVPEREDIVEIYQLTVKDQRQLLRESSLLSSAMTELFRADKMNIAAIGNVVPQLHVHHIARYRNDAAWPKPVWGFGEAIPYDKKQLKENIGQLKEVLAGSLID